jgi:hypothetical protein
VIGIIAAHGGLAALHEQYLKVENPPFMPLVIEHVGTGPRGLPAISVAHTYLENGDVMYDPEMVFETSSDTAWEPISYRQDGFPMPTQVAVWKGDDGRVMHRPTLVASLKAFARQWDYNIQNQGYLEARQEANKG